MKYHLKLFLGLFLLSLILVVPGCGGGGGGGSVNPVIPSPSPTVTPTSSPDLSPSPTTNPTEQINQLLDNFETAYKNGDVSLFKSCITDPCTYYNNPPVYHIDITEIDTYVSYKYASRQIQIIDSNKATVTSVNVNKELSDDYLESYDNEILEIVKVNDTWKITKINSLPFTPITQDTTELNQLFDNLGQAMLAGKNLNQVSNCVNYPFSQYSYPNKTIFNSQTDLQNYLNANLTYDTFDIVINSHYYIGSVDSEYVAKIEIIATEHGAYPDETTFDGYITTEVLLKKVDTQWKIYKINGQLLY